MGTFFNPFESQKGGGGGGGDSSTYSVRKIVDSATEQVSYKLTKTTNGSTIDVGEVIAFTGDEVLVDYDGQTILLNAAVENLKELAEQGKQEVTFSSLEIDTHNKTLSQLSAELAAKNLEEGTVVTGRVYSEALPYNNYGNAEVLVNNSILWWKTSSSTISPYSWNAIVVGNTVKMDWTPTYYQLPIASAQSLGGVKIGDNVQIAPDGTISVITTKGDTGTGIASIAKTSSSGLNDIYTITYTDSTTSTFTVTNGATITGGSIGQTGHLILTMSDGRTIDAGALPTDNEVEVTTTSSQPADPNVELWVDLSTQQTLDIPEINDSSTSSTQDTWSCKKIYDEQQRQEEEIGVVANAGVKNLLKFRDNVPSASAGNVYTRINSDGTLSVGLTSGTTATAQLVFTLGSITNYRDRKLILSGCPAGGNYQSGYALYISNDGSTAQADTGSGATLPIVTGVTSSVVALMVRSGTAISSELTFRPMVRDANIVDSTFIPYALPNSVLTPALIEQVNNGAKNLCNVADFPTTTAAWRQTTLGDGVTLPAGEYVLSFTNITSDADGTLMQIMCAKDISFAELTSDYFHIPKGTNTSKKFRLTGDTTAIRIYAGSSYAGSQGKSLSFSGLMICSVADYAVSPKFVPYKSVSNGYSETELLAAPVVGDSVSSISPISLLDSIDNYDQLVFRFGINDGQNEQGFVQTFLSSDIRSNVILSLVGYPNTQYNMVYGITRNTSTSLTVTNLVKNGWPETATIFSIKGIKY